jgi:ribonucleoside-diphosphate reductase alpha chain
LNANAVSEDDLLQEAPGRGLDYHELNAMLNLYGANGKIQFDADREAAREYFLQHVNQNTVFFHSCSKERLDYLVEKEYYEPAVLEKYSIRVHPEAQRPRLPARSSASRRSSVRSSTTRATR